MQKFLLYTTISLMVCFSANAGEIMSEDMLLGSSVGTVFVPEDEPKADTLEPENQLNDESEESSFWNLIKKPLSLFSFSATKEVITKDGKKETALEQSIRMAQEGSLADQLNLGYMYLYGTNGVEQNFKKALEYYTMAAKQNDAVALNNLGSLYFSGIGVEANTRKALEFFTKSADLGNDNAAVNLGFIYLTGGTKDEERNLKALKLFEQAADKGNNIAKFMLGYAYYKGFMVEPDYAKAYKLIKTAAGGEALFDEAQLVLGEMLIEGLGTVQNYQKGVASIRAAVSQGNLQAIMVAAKIYSVKKYVHPNPLMAHALYNIAASRDVVGAAELRDETAKKLQLEQLSQAQAQAQQFKPNPSELTKYIRQTFGHNVRSYIDNNM